MYIVIVVVDLFSRCGLEEWVVEIREIVCVGLRGGGEGDQDHGGDGI